MVQVKKYMAVTKVVSKQCSKKSPLRNFYARIVTIIKLKLLLLK